MINLIGTAIQHYQILVKVRETPTRVLFKAYDTRVHTNVALEVVKFSRLDSARLLERLNEQGHKNAALTHPNIAVMMDSGIHDGHVYIVYGFCPTHPLRRFLNRVYSWQEMSRDMASIVHALAHAHENGIVHGFLNPASIMLDEKRNPVLFDFGFERIITDLVLARSPGAWINRWGFEYRPPEQLAGAPPDHLADIYAFGMIMYEWLTGGIAFLAPTLLGTLQIRRSSIFDKKNKKKKSTVPPVIEAMVHKCIDANPRKRYQSMQEVFVLLAHGALDMNITKRMARKPLTSTSQRSHHQRLLPWLGILFVLVMAVGVFWINRSGILQKDIAPIPTVSAVTSTLETTQPPAPITPSPTATPEEDPKTNPTIAPNPNFSLAFQGSPLTFLSDQALTPEEAYRTALIGQWGMGDLNAMVASPDGKRVAVGASIGVFVFKAQDLSLEKFINTRTWVNTVAFSSDGMKLAAGDRDGLIQLWNTSNWQEYETPLSGHGNRAILDLAFSPDGTQLASVAEDEQLISWKLEGNNGQLTGRVHVAGVTSVAYSSDNSRLVTGGNDFRINLWSAEGLAPQSSLDFKAKVVDIAGVGGTSQFVVGGSDQQVQILDIANGMSLKSLGSLQYNLTTVAASPGGNYLAAGDLKGGITVWDSNGSVLWKKSGDRIADASLLDLPGSLHSLSFSSDGKTLFSGLHDGILRGVNSANGEITTANESFNGHVNKLAVSRKNTYAVTQHANNLVTVWNVKNGKPLYQWQGTIRGTEPTSPDEHWLALALDDRTVKVYELSSGKETYTLNGNNDLRVVQFVEIPSADFALAAGNFQEMHLWSMTSGQELKIKRNYTGQGCPTISDLDDKSIFSMTNFEYVISNNQNTAGLCDFQKQNWMININENAGLIAFGGRGRLSVLNITSGLGKPSDMSNIQFNKNIVSVALSPDGRLLASAFDDKYIHLWDVAARQEVMLLYGHKDAITDLRFTPDGRLLISTSMDGTILLWGIPK